MASRNRQRDQLEAVAAPGVDSAQRPPEQPTDPASQATRDATELVLSLPCAADYRALYRRRFAEAVRRWADDNPEVPTQRDYVRKRMSRARSETCIERIIRLGTQPIGTISAIGVSPVTRDCSLAIVIVSPGDWSRGYGSCALRKFLELLRDQGMRCVHLETFADNLRAQRAFRRVGFEDVLVYTEPEHAREILLMSCRLQPTDAAAPRRALAVSMRDELDAGWD